MRHYAGRWVALAQGRIAGVGDSAKAARAAAQLARPKEKLKVFLVAPEFPSIVEKVKTALPADTRAWLVGGAVRDALLNRRIGDFDFIIAESAIRAARAVANKLDGAFYIMDEERDIARVLVTDSEGKYTLDFARLRGETLDADLQARDFTINALAVELANLEELIDPHNGERDLRTKTIRYCQPTAFANDPIRVLRAIRFAAQLDFKLEKETRQAIRQYAPALAEVSPERQRDEFIRCLGNQHPQAALRALDLLGILKVVVPELDTLKGVTQSPPHVFDVWEHTLTVVGRLEDALSVLKAVHDVDAASDLTLGLVSVQLGRHRVLLSDHLAEVLSGGRPVRWLLMLAALLHDIGKPPTRTVEESGRIRFFNHELVGAEITERRLEKFHFSADEVQRVKTIVAHHMRPRQMAQEGHLPSNRAIYRYFRETGAAGVDIVLLSLADYLAKDSVPPDQDEWAHHLAICAKILSAYFEKPQEIVAPTPLITGHDILNEFQVEAGPHIGTWLEAVREAQVEGELSTREQALELVKRLIAETPPQQLTNGAGKRKKSNKK